ncbi:MAG: ABC transporter ATP-binding protein [Alphaproteobacteria bacterium]|nr:ABC transporter ATP-binding protein [Alphaproteobacteria bacterium]
MSGFGTGGGRPEPLLVGRNITKEFGSGDSVVQVLKGVNIDLVPGELTLLMGPSGSGKTTLLSILGCILRQTQGSLEIAGHETQNLKPEAMAILRRNHVGFVFQSYNLFPTLTAMENVMLALDVRGRVPVDAEDRTRAALDSVGLSHRVSTYPAKLSGGEKQRVAIARALAGSPSVILADEPTAALDSENGQSVMQLMSDVSRDKSRAVLCVTHDHRILKFADRIIRIEDGVISTDERPKLAKAANAPAGKMTAKSAH